jgi:POT family proton-dependent oligopeptide transporter
LSSATMASEPSTLTRWAKRVLAKPIVYKHVPEDDTLIVGVACVF